MSDPGHPTEPRSARNCAQSQVPSRLAQPVHGCISIVSLVVYAVLAAASSGCVIPPSLSVDNQDAGTNSPPAILALNTDQQELSQPGPVLFDRGRGSVKVSLIDTDLADVLYVKIFVDYTVNAPTAPRATCTAAGDGSSAQRSCTADLIALCLPADVGQERLMGVYVFDRLPLEAGSPPYMNMPEGGLSTNRIYELKCQEPTQ